MSAKNEAKKGQLHVVLCWHMHQPQYCDLISGEYKLPWTYLHAIKDYVDMAAHIEAVPSARAVVNFAPVLLEQLTDYAAQISNFLRENKPIRDPLLAALAEPVLPVDGDRKRELVSACLRVNSRVIERFPDYQCLSELAKPYLGNCADRVCLSDQLMADLVFWYHLGWMAETVRRSDLRVQHWQQQGRNFSLQDRRELLVLIGELMSGVIDRYAALANSGQVELSVTPYAHPIIPLMLDINCACEATPDAPLPELQVYPGGEQRAHWHVREGLNVFEQHFQRKPAGCWPAEGGVSQATLELLESYGFRWTASGETVLKNSLHASNDETVRAADAVLKGYQVAGGKLVCFFRDDKLSDEIGFNFSTWHADDAVANFIHNLENVAAAHDGRDLVLPIILDGENAWEHFPENGYYFLRTLYEKLADHPTLTFSTFSECLDAGIEISQLPTMISGSWVHGTFSTWIGDRDKNRGWDMLGDAKCAYDRAVAQGGLDSDQIISAERQLSVCEGSDWFWWFGDYNPADSVSDFEALFRLHLANLYELLGVEPPEYLAHTFAHGSGDPSMGGTMRHGQSLD